MLIPHLRSFVRNVFTRRSADDRLNGEMDEYIRMLAAEHRSRGLAADAAVRQARIDAGGVEQVKEGVRDVRAGAALDSLLNDLKVASRRLRRSPVFAVTTILTLALGIGATLVVFEIANAVLVRPLPYLHPDQLVTVLQHGTDPVAPGDYLDWKASMKGLGQMEAAEYWTPTLGIQTPDKVTALRVTPGMLKMLGVVPLLGPGFAQVDGAREVVLGNAIWKNRFGSDSSIVGKSIVLNAQPHVVVGVMPAGFQFAPFWVTDAELWTPMALAGKSADHNASSLRLFARLAPGRTIDQVQRELDAVTSRLAAQFRESNTDIRVTNLTEKAVGNTRRPLTALIAAVLFVLLITWANVGHMLLARAYAREQELSVHVALGASRMRIIRSALAESVLLTAIGGVAAAAAAQSALQLIAARGPFDMPQLCALGFDWRLTIVAVVLLAATALVISVLPALLADKASRATTMRIASRGSTETAARTRLRTILLAAEMAFGLVLLVGTSLMVRTVTAMRAIDPGFQAAGAVTMQVPLPRTADAPEQRVAWFRSVAAQLRDLPGVTDAGFINHLPLAGDEWGAKGYGGRFENASSKDTPRSVFRVVTPGLMPAMRIRLEQGRYIAETDDATHDPVVIINRRLANTLWPGTSAVGQRMTFDRVGGQRTWMTVIGVVSDVKQSQWTAASAPEVYVPYAQTRAYLSGDNSVVKYLTLVVRTKNDVAVIANAVRQVMHNADPGAPITDIQTLTQVVDGMTAKARFLMDVLIGFGVLALVLAAIGFYGVMSYSVTQRRREIGIRMALGESAVGVARSLLAQTGRISIAGIVAGSLMTLGLSRFIAGQLYGVAPRDPASFAFAAGCLAVVAVVATAGPMIRALRTDPVSIIRSD